jgi:hypothetical protein
MTKEEFEAIESVDRYLCDQATKYAILLGHDNAPTLEECVFWIKSFKKFGEYYHNAVMEYYNLKD